MTEEDKIRTLNQLIRGSENVVFFGGAGVSTESGVPDFRSQDGLYNQHYKYPPETILSHTFYRQLPGEGQDPSARQKRKAQRRTFEACAVDEGRQTEGDHHAEH